MAKGVIQQQHRFRIRFARVLKRLHDILLIPQNPRPAPVMRRVRGLVHNFPGIVSIPTVSNDGLNVLFQNLIEILRRPSPAIFSLKVKPPRRCHIAVHQAMSHELHLMLLRKAHSFVHGIEIKPAALRLSDPLEHDRHPGIELPRHHWLVSGIVVPHSALDRCTHPEFQRFSGLTQALVPTGLFSLRRRPRGK